VLLLEREAHLAEIALVIRQLKGEPGAPVFHQLEAAVVVGLLASLLNDLAGVQVGDLTLKQGGSRIAAQGGVLLARLQDRINFLTEQKDDLHKGENSLKKVLAEIDQRMEFYFKEAFEQINENFKQTYIELFEGGQVFL
jgi:hypothetical protein